MKIAVFGAGVAGLKVVKALKEVDVEITLVDPKDYVEVPFAALRGMMDPDGFGKSIRKPISEFLSVPHEQAKLSVLKKSSALLDNGKEIDFDYAVVATGSTIRGFENLKVAEKRSLSEREDEFRAEHEKFAAARGIVIIGGGPIGVELTGEILSRFKDKKLTLIQSADQLLPALSPGAGKKAKKVYEREGVRVVLNERAEAGPEGKGVRLGSGETIAADLVVTAIGIRVDTSFSSENFTDSVNEHHQVRVDQYLRLPGTDNIFVIGDANDTPVIKLGAIASMQAVLTAKNIQALLIDRPLRSYKPMSGPLGFITLGKKAGIAQFPFGRIDLMIAVKQKDMFSSMYLK